MVRLCLANLQIRGWLRKPVVLVDVEACDLMLRYDRPKGREANSDSNLKEMYKNLCAMVHNALFLNHSDQLLTFYIAH